MKKIKIPLLIFIVLFSLFFITASGNIDSIDGNTSIFLAKKMLLEHKIYFLKSENSLGMPVFLDKIHNRYYPIYNFGYAFTLIPGVGISYLTRSLLSVRMPNYPFQPDFLIILYDNLLNGFLISLCGVYVYKIILIFKPRLEKETKLIYLIPIVLASTNLIVQGHHSFAHPLFTCLFLTSLYYFIKYNRNKNNKYLWLFALCFALTASSYNATFILSIPAFVVFTYLEKNRVSLKILLSFIPAVVIQMIWNYARFNNIFKTGYLELGLTIFDSNPVNFIQNMYGMTFTLNKGFFVYNMIVAVPIIYFLIRIAKKKKTPFMNLFIFFSVLFLAYVGNYSLATIWHGDVAYGPRYLTPLVPVGLILFFLIYDKIRNKISHVSIYVIIVIGIIVQIPGFLMPPFALRYVSPAICMTSLQEYFYNWRCAHVKVGWSHILKRRLNETVVATGQMGKINTISLSFPNPVTSFRTVYPDPLFDQFSKYKVTDYKLNKKMMDDIYSFIFDIWWMKGVLYKNIFNL